MTEPLTPPATPLATLPGREAEQAGGMSLRVAAGAFCAIALVLFGGFVFAGGGWMASNVVGDGTRYFIFMRGFYAEQLLAGNLPLWNPHTFSGLPFVGVFQSAVFYPLNLIYLVLDTARGLSVDFALHLVVLLTCSYAWLRGWGLRSLAAFFGALVVGLSAPNFLRVLAGQLTVLDTLCWTPLLLLAIDRLAVRRSLGWVLCAVATTTLMLLAGHPPTVFMAAFFVGLYALLRLVSLSDKRGFLLSLAPIAVIPPVLAAVQLLPGLQIAAEGIRSGGTDYAFATSFSFPPENLLTLFVPYAFGAVDPSLIFSRTWYGRWFYWDASLYLGVVSCLLVAAGIARGPGAASGKGELRRLALILSPTSVLLALGAYTPVYRLFYEVVPGFSLFRAPSKFVFFTALFGAALAAIGIDRLQARDQSSRTTLRFALGVAAVFAGGAMLQGVTPPDGEGGGVLVRWLASLNPDDRFPPSVLEAWHGRLLRGFGVAAAGAFVVALLLLGRERADHEVARRRWLTAVIVLGALELGVFAWSNRGGTWSQSESVRRPKLAATYASAGTDRAIFERKLSNLAMAEHGYDLWGYDPVVLLRYAEFMAFTQQREVADMNNIGGRQPDSFHPLFSMLRGRFLVHRSGEVEEHPGAFPRFYLTRQFEVVGDRADVLSRLVEPGFDPRRTLVLETPPDPPLDQPFDKSFDKPLDQPKATPDASSVIELLDESADHLTLSVDLASPGILVITDAWAEGWRAIGLPGSVQQRYSVMPGNYVLRAIPLAAGKHLLRVEYSPMAYRIGGWITSVSGVAYGVVVLAWLVRVRRQRAG